MTSDGVEYNSFRVHCLNKMLVVSDNALRLMLNTCLRVLVDTYNLHMVLSPTQSIIFKDIDPKDKEGIEEILRMAELEFVGDGANSYQLWLGGSPVLAESAARENS